MTQSLLSHKHFFFVGVAGAGMSAIALYLCGNNKKVSGSDRQFEDNIPNETRAILQKSDIHCYEQNASGIDSSVDVIVVSTAIEESNIEIQKAKSLNIPIVLRADLLAAICKEKYTIAIAGTSGKSTTTAMLFHILHTQGKKPSLISGAALVSLQQEGLLGNAYCGDSDILLIEADESDGTLVKYEPQIGVLLSIDKDHKELDELLAIFNIYRSHCNEFIVNRDHALAKEFSQNIEIDFGTGSNTEGKFFSQQAFSISFKVNDVLFQIPTIGKHNMENALACIAVAKHLGVSELQCAQSLATYKGIHRRHQMMGQINGITLIDDYAHNPAKIAASIKACQPVGKRLIAWFQPHGYGPTRFIRHELVQEIANTLRQQDEIWMSEIYYAGGTAVKDISAQDLIHDLKEKSIKATFIADRDELFNILIPTLQQGDVLLLMGARDPSLETFAYGIKNILALKQ